MEYVLDTNVISEIAKPQPDHNVLCWIQDHNESVYLNSVSLEELYYGIFIMPEGKKKEALRAVFDAIVHECNDRTFMFDAFCGYTCAEIRAQARKNGRTGTIEDFMIAAICLRNDATLVTRNVKDFDYIEGLKIVDPFTYEPPLLAELKRREASGA